MSEPESAQSSSILLNFIILDTVKFNYASNVDKIFTLLLVSAECRADTACDALNNLQMFTECIYTYTKQKI